MILQRKWKGNAEKYQFWLFQLEEDYEIKTLCLLVWLFAYREESFFFLERWIWCGVQVMNQSRWYIIYISKMGLLGCCAHEKDRDKGYLGIFEFVFDYSVTWWRVLFFLCSKWQVATCRVYTIRRLNKKIKKEERQFGVGGHIFNMV